MRLCLDHNAATPLRPEAAAAMAAARSAWANPSSVHSDGQRARNVLEDGRRRLADALGVRPGELVLTGSATEANNLAVKGHAFARMKAGDAANLWISVLEHPSVLAPARWVAGLLPDAEMRPMAFDAQGAPTGPGWSEASFAAVTAADSELGVIPNHAEVKRRLPEGAHLHRDATQAVGRIPLALEASGAASATISSHKLGGPRGIAALWVRSDIRLESLVHGGGQERGRRAGTEDPLALAGFAAAVAAAVAEEAEQATNWRRQIATFETRLRMALPDLMVVGTATSRLPNTLAAALPGIAAEDLVMALDLAGLSISAGKACSSGSLEASPVALALGLSEEIARGIVRISMGRYCTDSDMDRAAALMVQAVEQIAMQERY